MTNSEKPNKFVLVWVVFKYHIFLSSALLLFITILSIAYWTGFGDKEPTIALYEWIDPVAGIMTFITTLVIFGMQAYKNWEQSLEKRLNVNFWYSGENDAKTQVARVIGAYLSGENDIRAWAQQLGKQMLGDLDIDMNWDDPPPKIQKVNKGNYFKQYEIDVFLTTNPLKSNKGKISVQSFLNRKFQHSTIKVDTDHWPLTWERMDQAETIRIQMNKGNPT